VVQKKTAQSLMHHHSATICSRISFHQNAQKLTGNTRSGQLLNIVLNIIRLAAGKETALKVSIPATFSWLSWQKRSLQKANITKLI